MEVTVNGKELIVPKGAKVVDLIKYLNYSKSIAVFVNEKQLLQSEYESFEINKNDSIRVIKPLGGG